MKAIRIFGILLLLSGLLVVTFSVEISIKMPLVGLLGLIIAVVGGIVLHRFGNK